MSRLLRLLPVLTLLLAACSSDDGTTTSSAPATTTTAAATTTTATAPPTTAPPTTTRPPSDVADRLGLGDSRYPGLGNGGYDVDHYAIDLTFDPTPNTINALVAITATATEPLDAFSLDFVGFEVTDVTVEGTPSPFERMDDELIIHTTTTIPQGETFTTTVSYNGTPGPIVSEALPFQLGWRTAPNGVAYVVAEPDGGRSWLPLNDHPSDKATYTFRVTVPEPLIAAANGTLVERITDLGWSTWVWESEHPMASYLATVVIGALEIVEDTVSTAESAVPVRNVLPSDLVATPSAVLETQGEMIVFLSDLFGPYPFEAYGIAVVDGFEAALENQTLSIFGREMTEFPQFFETVLVHELAHQWFGNSVTPVDWGDVWLNEGFATYAEWLWVEHKRGDAALAATVRGSRNQMSLSSQLAPPGNPPADDLFNASVYVRGALVLHALRAEIGDEAFFQTLTRYVETYRHSNASTADFINVAESVSGTDLENLFDTWLFGETVPELP
ncbi:MAG: M1 family metallopeptidase [Actinomycetota bacterium]|nr:M1 family metallopeptidase [Actinomycetota bacterium]